jgi:hypothetical protein
MKKIIFFIGLISQFSFSQIEKEVGDFNKVTSFDKIDVLLIPSNENKVILIGDNAEDVELVNKNGELKIRMPFTKLLKGDEISATVYYTNLDAIEANEGSRIASEATFEGTSFEVIAKENSEIKIKVNVSKINIRGGAGSSITVDGEADYQDVLLNSGALLFANKLITKQTTITVNAGGDADVYATDLVDAKVRAGGLITIFGNPKQINQKTIAGGRIEQVK